MTSLIQNKVSDLNFWFLGFGLIFLLGFWGALITEEIFLAGLPFAFLFAFLIISDPKKIFYLFFAILPFSIEVELPGGFGTDLPSEPIMLVLLGIFTIFILLGKIPKIKSILLHPISIILFCHLSWICFSSIFAVNKVYAFKFLLAKIWYVLPFFFLPFVFLKKLEDYRFLLKLFILALSLSVGYVMLRHGSNGFSFKTINDCVRPIYRNHVNYSAILALSMPFVWYLNKTSKHKWFWILLASFLLLATYLSYTRAAYLVVLSCIAGYYMIKFRLTILAILLSGLLVLGYLWYNIHNANYLSLAPNYERTVAHYKFDNLVEATYKMEDISTMERLYRWVAGFQMIKEKPIVGFGPSNFYSNYKDYSVASFKTYVSDNPEKSGIHNNYLMVLVEQGIPGFIIMMILSLFPLVYAERLYQRIKSKQSKDLLMAFILSFLAIDIFIIINDLLEADKVGPFYFMSLAVIVFFDLKEKISS